MREDGQSVAVLVGVAGWIKNGHHSGSFLFLLLFIWICRVNRRVGG